METANNASGIEQINVDSLIWSEADQTYLQEERPFSVYTVGKSIKNNYVLQHIKPDYGSLGQFMKDVGISKDILLHNRKKKADQQEDIQQKKIRQNLRDKKLQQVIKENNVSTLQKSIASKMIVENLFEKNFGVTLNSFCLQNGKLQNSKINYSSVSQLTDMLDKMIHKPRSEIQQFQELKKVDYPALARNKNILSSKQISTMGLKQRLSIIYDTKQNYSSLKKCNIQLDKENNKCQQLSLDPLPLLSFINEEVQFDKIFQKIKFVKMESINFIKLSNVNISDDLFCFLLDLFTKIEFCFLSELTIQNVKFQKPERIIIKIKEFIEGTKIKRLRLVNVGLKSKDFCVLCLGIGSKLSFEYLSLKNNDVGQIALKCLNVLMKFHKQIKFDFSGNPIARELTDNKRYRNCFASM